MKYISTAVIKYYVASYNLICKLIKERSVTSGQMWCLKCFGTNNNSCTSAIIVIDFTTLTIRA